MAASRPNILLIMSDEHDRKVAGCYGDKLVRTPNLDALAAGGITFDACYTTSPLCVPARLSFTACQYVSRCGSWNNSTRLQGNDIASLPNALNAAGYRSYLGGKMHYDAEHRYGFIDLEPSCNAHYQTGLSKWRRPDDTTVNAGAWSARSANFRIGDESHTLNYDRKVTRVCTQFLRDRKAGEPPFFLLAGYLAPHFPLVVPEPIANRYLDKVPPPNVPAGMIEKYPRNHHHLRRGFGVETAPAGDQKRGRDLYWGMVDWFDQEVGKLLATLRANPAIADNTIIVYTSDHGENKGDHGHWWKNNLFEHSAGVPLIVNFPPRWKGGQRRSQVCSLLDLVQTVVEWAGGQADETWDGDSLTPILDNPAAPWKDFALSEYYGHNICSGVTMFRQGRWKYVYHNSAGAGFPAERELYDLQSDPGELTNLAARPEQADRIAAMHSALIRELGEDPEQANLRCMQQMQTGYGRPPRPDGKKSADE